MEEIPSSEILAEIQKGRSTHDGVIIRGDLDIRKIGIQKKDEIFHIDSIIEITNSQIVGAINFANTEFKNDFDRIIDFTGTTLSGKVNFSMAHFCEGANFRKVHFAEDVDFESAKFCGAVFTEARLDGYSNFKKAEFYYYAIFAGIQFNNYANFVKARFKPAASFHWACFNDNANFSRAKFCERANFARARFYIDANFANAEFERTISLKEAIFTRIDVSWDSIKNHIEYNDTVYLELTKNYNNLGLFVDADNCYYQYRLKRAAKLKGLDKLIDFISFITYGYGVRSKYPLIALLVILFVFCGIYLLEKQASFPDVFRLSLVILTTTTETSSLTGDCRWWSLLERISGWLLMSSFLVVLAKKTIR